MHKRKELMWKRLGERKRLNVAIGQKPNDRKKKSKVSNVMSLSHGHAFGQPFNVHYFIILF